MNWKQIISHSKYMHSERQCRWKREKAGKDRERGRGLHTVNQEGYENTMFWESRD